jgi:tetratricopeptide (TPR) repeat protein
LNPKSAISLETALKAIAEGQLELAKEIGARLLEEAPLDPATHQLLAAIALQGGCHEDAARWAHSCLDLRPDYAPAALLAGHAARGLGDHDRALAFFQKAEVLAPERPEAAFMACVVLLEQGDSRANAALHHLLSRFPENAPGWHEIGKTLRKAGKLEAALVAFSRAANAAPRSRYDADRASVLIALGRFAEAADVLRTASVSSGSADIALQLALCHHRLGNLAEARAILESLLLKDDRHASGWFLLGLVCQDAGDIPAASAAYRRSLELRPSLAEAHVNLGICLQRQGDLAGAKTAYAEAIRHRADTFGRIAQALPAAPKGELWLNPERLRQSLGAAQSPGAEPSSVDAGPA